ncbi:MAG: glutamate--tRNA ligase [Gammaproteobacteria bacterium]
MRSMSDSGVSVVRTRFAPSPTGRMHLGNARTALFNWLFARRHDGRFVLRSEDTDAARSRAGFLDELLDDLDWLGLDRDEGPGTGGENGPYRQTERTDIYARRFAQLERAGAAFECYCTPEELAASRRAQAAEGRPPRYAGTCRELSAADREHRMAAGRLSALRFRVPTGRRIVFEDLVRGPQQFASDDIGDFVIRRADGTPAFFFGNALDDALMRITHVLRGEDHLANTPRQLLLLEALGLAAPRYGHLALLTDSGGAPLSKRRGSPSLRMLAEAGFLPAAVANYLARLGHAYATDDCLDLEALAHDFDVARLGRAPARYDRRQLEHWQRLAVTCLEHSEPAALVRWLGEESLEQVPEDRREHFAALVAPNVLFPNEARDWGAALFGESLELDEDARQIVESAGPEFFNSALDALSRHGPQAVIHDVSVATGARGRRLFLPLRLAVTGRSDGPELERLIAMLPPEILRRRFSRWADATPNAEHS